MILTDKAKVDFEKWYLTKRHFDSLTVIDSAKINQFYRLNDTMVNALIIDFFDSVGIYIDSFHSYAFDQTLEYCVKVNNTFIDHGISNKPINRFESRQKAIEQGILKANTIYNENNN